jgi:hypothetical protein
MSDLRSLDTLLTRQQEWVDKHVGPWFGAVFLFGILRFVLEKAADVHWVVGFIATGVLATILGSLLWGWRKKLYLKYSPKNSKNDVGALLLATVLFAIAVFAGVSMLIYKLQPASYSPASKISMGTLTDYYSWVTLDALPGIHFAETFDVKAPVEHHGVAAAISLVAFRLLVLGTLLKALKEWLAFSPAAAEPAPEAASATPLIGTTGD